jgi:hypothetical protein
MGTDSVLPDSSNKTVEADSGECDTWTDAGVVVSITIGLVVSVVGLFSFVCMSATIMGLNEE